MTAPIGGVNTGSGQTQEIIIKSVDHVTNEMVIENISANIVDLSSGDICRPFIYASFATHPVLAAIAPGAEITIHMTDAGVDTPTDVYMANANLDIQASDELMVYRTASGHMQDNIEAYVRYGPAAPVGREGQADAVGLWTLGDAVDLCPGDNAFIASGDVTTAAGFTSIASGTTCP